MAKLKADLAERDKWNVLRIMSENRGGIVTRVTLGDTFRVEYPNGRPVAEHTTHLRLGPLDFYRR